MPDTPDDTPETYRSRQLIGWLWSRYLVPFRGLIAIAFVVMVVEGSTLGALSYMLKPLFDTVFASGSDAALWAVGFGILALFVIRAIASIIAKTLLARVAQGASNAMQADLLDHLLTLDGSFYQTHPPGDLIERVQGDTLAVQGIWIVLLTGVARDLVSLIGLMAVALSIDAGWTLAALIGAPLLILPAITLQRYIRRKSMSLRNEAGLRATRLDEIFHGIHAVKLNRMEAYQAGRFRAILQRIIRAEVRSAAGRAAMPAMIDVVTGIGFFAVLVLGGREVADGTRTTGEFMAFFTAMALTFQPLRRLGELAGTWQIAAASLQRIRALFDLSPRNSRPPTSLRQPAGTTIVLQDVRLSYGETPVLNGLTFTAEAGQMTALVGPSGAGKTTVFHLLTGLVDPQSGQISIGGAPTLSLSLRDQRALFAAVSQDSALFDETLRENVLLGRADVPPATLQAALDAARVTDFVAGLPMGLDTPAGPRGSALSGGQRQRIAIARALLRDAPVLLLDEATSALDAQSEQLVADALLRLGAGRTSLVIAHRLATVRRADKIVVIDGGRVVQQGTHEALLAQGGLYADLYRLQFKD